MAKADEFGELGEFGDEQLENLFASFDGMGASESLKASTLELIAAAAPAAGSSAGSSPEVTARAGGKRPKPRLRSVRIAAAAASLAIVVTGGAAYATPTSLVTLSQGDASVELGVNYFGISVVAESDDEAGREIVESTNLVHVPCEDAISRAADALDAVAGDDTLELIVESADGSQRERLENMGQMLVSTRNDAKASANYSPDGPDDGLVGDRPAGGRVDDQVAESGAGAEAPSDSAWSGGSAYSIAQPTLVSSSDGVARTLPSDTPSQENPARADGDEGANEGANESKGKGKDSGNDNKGADSNKGKTGADDSKPPIVGPHPDLGSEPELEWVIEPDSDPDSDFEEEESVPADEIDFFQDGLYPVDGSEGFSGPSDAAADSVAPQGFSQGGSGQGLEDPEGAPSDE